MTDTPDAAPQPPQPGGYAAAGPGPMPVMQPQHPQAVLILILGIMSVMGCFILGPVALFMGLRARKDAQAAPNGYSNANLITIGWVCGLIGTIALVFWILYIVFFIVFAAATSGG